MTRINKEITVLLGRYFWFNKNVRRLRRFEGDTMVESRFGQSIRFGVYDENRLNDVGDKDIRITTKHLNPNFDNTGGGNPMLLIRNRQRPINEIPKTTWGQDEPTDIDKEYENQYYSQILESVNWDGSSIHITSGLTKTKWDWISILKRNILVMIYLKNSWI